MIRAGARVLTLTAVGAFLYVPIFVVAASSLNGARQMSFPPSDLTLSWYVNFFADPAWYGALTTSIGIATGAAALGVAVSVMACYVLWRDGRGLSAALYRLAMVPFLLPGIVFAVSLSLVMSYLGLVGSPVAVVLGHAAAVIAVPLLTINLGFAQIDRSVLDAARTMGVKPAEMLPAVLLPLLRPYILTGALFAFILSMNEYVIAMLLSGFSLETLPMRVLNSQRYGFTPSLSVGTVVYMVFSLVALSWLGASGRLYNLFGLSNGTTLDR